MKMNTNVQTVERSGVQGESGFQIRASAKAFEILSKSLYKDPILAVIRELSCNAYDAHIAAGRKDVPFSIHLPNTLESYLSVKDDGIGLSDEDIRGTPILDANGNDTGERSGGLYTTYFDSTKTDSNDAIGAFGLGSKSPYSYAEAFNVISRHNGRKCVYTMYLDEGRLPRCALMSDEPTDEHPGLEVRIDTKPSDQWTFRDRAASVLRFFKVKPNVTGVSNFKFEELPQGQFSGDGWMVYAKDRYSSGHFTAVMGQVPYRVDADKLADHLPNSVLAFLRTVSAVVFFEIGELEIPPDREEVRYNEKTLRALVTRISDIRKSFITELERRVNELPDQTFWAKYQSIRKISCELFGDEKEIVTFLQGETTNVDLLRYCEAIKARGLLVPTPLSGHIVTMMNNATGRRALVAFKRDKSTIDREVDTESEEEGAWKIPSIYVTPTEKTLVVYSDVNTAEMKRLRLHVQELRNTAKWPDRVLVIRRLTQRNARNMGMAHPGAQVQDAEFASICNALGNPPVVRLSTVKNLGGGSTVRRPLPIYQWDGCKYRRRVGYRNEWKSGFLTDDLKDKGALYFVVDKSKTIRDHNDNEVNWSNNYEENMKAVVKLINTTLGTKYDHKSILGVSVLTHRRIKNNPNWKNVFEVAVGLVQKYSNAVEMYRNYMSSEDVFGFKDTLHKYSDGVRSKLIKHINLLDDASPFKIQVKPLVDGYNAIQTSDLEVVQCVNLIEERILRRPASPTSALVPQGTQDQLRKKYPMLTFTGRLDYNHFDKFFEYVSLIDRS